MTIQAIALNSEYSNAQQLVRAQRLVRYTSVLALGGLEFAGYVKREWLDNDRAYDEALVVLAMFVMTQLYLCVMAAWAINSAIDLGRKARDLFERGRAIAPFAFKSIEFQLHGIKRDVFNCVYVEYLPTVRIASVILEGLDRGGKFEPLSDRLLRVADKGLAFAFCAQ